MARIKVRNHLCAYATWCLEGDLEYWERLDDDRRLREIWNPIPASRLADEMGDDRDAWEDLLGGFEVQSAEEAREELKDAKEAVSDRIERIERWLSHPKLKEWRQEYEERSNGRDRAVSFFELLKRDESSVWKRLKSRDLRFAYPDYDRTSKAIHGNTLEQSVNFAGPVAFPLVGVDADDLDAAVSQISSSVQWCAMVLYLVRPSNIRG